ncbi:hypothetical protein HGO37_07920 [Rhizobium sp. CG4]|uniref:head-tail connector protein n=1 Tax=Rhizobium/Agrobacterium group TaxID=227290 RepID=UPI002034005B|nr:MULTISPECIES: hypothetical protein [Rhizobium/Agrobacterium group]MCM2455307.1 hypothetical protein [Rhizobium sp. CG4]MDO5895118.1 hypothetical protein [Agrobacterium sp. Azo12]
MHRPVLVTAPSALPVTLNEMKIALRIAERDGDNNILEHEDDGLITDEIRSAVEHYEGWTGILGIVLSEQTWRQSFDGFAGCLDLPLGPVSSISAARYRNAAGQVATIAANEYALDVSSSGEASIRFRNAYERPSDLYERASLQVDYLAGWPVVNDKSTVPADIKTAIKIRVQLSYDESARAGADILSRVEEALIGKYRRLSL